MKIENGELCSVIVQIPVYRAVTNNACHFDQAEGAWRNPLPCNRNYGFLDFPFGYAQGPLEMTEEGRNFSINWNFILHSQ